MNTAELAEELQATRDDFNKFRVEIALKLDKLERHVEALQGALVRAGLYVPAAASTAPSGHGRMTPMFGQRHHSLLVPTAPPAPTGRAVSSHVQTPGFAPAPHTYPQQPPHGVATPSRSLGSRHNAQYLPFVMERIALAGQRKSRNDRRTCTCGRPTFDLKCFLNHHFAWCLTHQRPVASGQQCSSSRDGRQCQHITWEKHPDWEVIVKTSFDSGYLGTEKVDDIYQILFPIEEYPEKYQNGWYIG